MNQSDFPEFDIVFESDQGRGEDEGIARRISGRCGVECVGGDERTHAFAIPDDFGFRVTLPNKLGEGVEIVIPLGGIADIAASFLDGIAALTAKLVGVNGGIGLAFDQIVSKVGVVDGVSAKPMNPDDDQILRVMVAFPSPVAERFSAFLGRDGIVFRRASVEAGE